MSQEIIKLLLLDLVRKNTENGLVDIISGMLGPSFITNLGLKSLISKVVNAVSKSSLGERLGEAVTPNEETLLELVGYLEKAFNKDMIVKGLLRYGADPNAKDSLGNTSLHLIVNGEYTNESERIKLVEAFVDHKNTDVRCHTKSH